VDILHCRVIPGKFGDPYRDNHHFFLRRVSETGILVSMTRKSPSSEPLVANPMSSRWRLQDAKARFSEVVRMAHRDGPQVVTLHGRDAVVVIDAAEFNRLKGPRNGGLLIEALQASPYPEIEIEPRRFEMPVRDVDL
jgi:prevent-host-death family protein